MILITKVYEIIAIHNIRNLYKALENYTNRKKGFDFSVLLQCNGQSHIDIYKHGLKIFKSTTASALDKTVIIYSVSIVVDG